MRNSIGNGIAIIALSLTIGNVSPCLAVEDTTPPRLQSVSIPSRARQGETIEVAVKATDDLSGISAVYIYVQRANGTPYSGTINPAQYNEQRKCYIEHFDVNQYDKLGSWKVTRVTIVDVVGNSANYVSPNDFQADCLIVQ